MRPDYRPAEPADADACAAIIHEWGRETPWMCTLDAPGSMAEFWRDQFIRDPAWIAHCDGQIVGFCARSDDNISALYVSRAARNHGVGKHLLDLAKEKRDWITVWAYEKNTEARRFYHREGLVEISREMEHYDDGVSLVDIEHRWTRTD